MKAIITSSALFALLTTIPLSAQGRGGGRGLNNDTAIAKREFAATQGKFEAWKTAILEGASLKSVGGDEAVTTAHSLYESMTEAVTQEFLSDTQFGELGLEYVKLVLKAPQLSQEKVLSDLLMLKQKLEDRATGTIQVASATPEVNRAQINAQELLWFGIASRSLSAGKRATIERKQAALITLEDRAKSDRKVSDREREKLDEEAKEVTQNLMEALS